MAGQLTDSQSRSVAELAEIIDAGGQRALDAIQDARLKNSELVYGAAVSAGLHEALASGFE